MALKLCPNTSPRIGHAEALAAMREIDCLGDLMRTLGAADKVSGTIVEFLGEKIENAAETVSAYLAAMMEAG